MWLHQKIDSYRKIQAKLAERLETEADDEARRILGAAESSLKKLVEDPAWTAINNGRDSEVLVKVRSLLDRQIKTAWAVYGGDVYGGLALQQLRDRNKLGATKEDIIQARDQPYSKVNINMISTDEQAVEEFNGVGAKRPIRDTLAITTLSGKINRIMDLILSAPDDKFVIFAFAWEIDALIHPLNLSGVGL
jgi:hypothetical protein